MRALVNERCKSLSMGLLSGVGAAQLVADAAGDDGRVGARRRDPVAEDQINCLLDVVVDTPKAVYIKLDPYPRACTLLIPCCITTRLRYLDPIACWTTCQAPLLCPIAHTSLREPVDLAIVVKPDPGICSAQRWACLGCQRQCAATYAAAAHQELLNPAHVRPLP